MIEILTFFQFPPVNFGPSVLSSRRLLGEAALISTEDVLSAVLSGAALIKAKLL